jgi:glycosyltransferase involved in cell wall biosynthesis
VEVIHNGVDLKTFKPKVKEIKDNGHIILGVASTWDARKGLQDFIELRKILAMEYKIVLIGLSNKQIEQLPKGIQGIQRTENVEALVDWYNKASVFVNPTYVDNFPTTNLEALACGTPVVTYNTGGSPEAIDHQTGAVVDKGDIKALSKAVLAMFKNKATVKACRERAGNKFNSNERYTDYLRLYQEIINHG